MTTIKTMMLGLMMAVALALPVRAEETRAAAPAQNSNIAMAVVDIQQLLRESKAAKDIETQLVSIRKSFQSEVEAKEKELRAAEKKLIDEKGKLKEEDLKAKVADFQKQVAESQKEIQEKKNKLDKAVATAIGKLRAQIVKVVAEIADKKSLDLVLARTDVVIVSKTLDITNEVLERINKDLPSVPVTVE